MTTWAITAYGGDGCVGVRGRVVVVVGGGGGGGGGDGASAGDDCIAAGYTVMALCSYGLYSYGPM